MSFSARSSRYLTMSLPSLFGALPRSRAYTVPRLRRLLQMGAAIGWLQGISSRSEEGRASWSARRENSSRSSEGRVLGSRIGSPQRTVAPIAGPPVLSSGCWVHDGFQMLSGLSDAPTQTTRCRCQAATEHRTNIAHVARHTIWNGELSSEEESKKNTTTRGRQD